MEKISRIFATEVKEITSDGEVKHIHYSKKCTNIRDIVEDFILYGEKILIESDDFVIYINDKEKYERILMKDSFKQYNPSEAEVEAAEYYMMQYDIDTCIF